MAEPAAGDAAFASPKGRKPFAIAGALFLTLAAGAAPAQDGAWLGTVVSALRADGYDQIHTERTLLNRIRIVAARPGTQREIVIDPRTGEVLRDYSRERNGEVPPPDADVIIGKGERERYAGPDGTRHHDRESSEDPDATDRDTP